MKLISHLPSTPLVFYTLPDTALQPPHRPFFIPDEGVPVIARPCLAVRVCRQGCSLHPRFARRYYDALAPAFHFVRQGHLQRLQSLSQPWDEAVGFDGAVRHAPFQPFTEDSPLVVTGAAPQTFSFTLSLQQIDGLLSAASRCFTIHQGDIILMNPAQLPPPPNLMPGMQLQVAFQECAISLTVG